MNLAFGVSSGSRGAPARGALALALSIAAATLCAPAARATEPAAEVQINLCTDAAQVVRALELTSESPEPVRVWLFDSPALELHRAGLRLRLREKGKRGELTLKAAGQDCSTVDPKRLEPDDKCEADLHGEQFDDVISLTRRLGKRDRAALLAPEAARGAPVEAALTKALTGNQRAFLDEQRRSAGKNALLPADIARLGPSSVRAYRRSGEAFVVEVWTLPGGQEFVELSEKTGRGAAITRRTELERRLAAAGVAVCSDQDSQAGKKLGILAR